MGAVLVNVDALDVFAVEVAAGVGAFVYDEAALAPAFCKASKGGAVEAGTDDEVVVHL